jgi:hypothetical protein
MQTSLKHPVFRQLEQVIAESTDVTAQVSAPLTADRFMVLAGNGQDDVRACVRYTGANDRSVLVKVHAQFAPGTDVPGVRAWRLVDVSADVTDLDRYAACLLCTQADVNGFTKESNIPCGWRRRIHLVDNGIIGGRTIVPSTDQLLQTQPVREPGQPLLTSSSVSRSTIPQSDTSLRMRVDMIPYWYPMGAFAAAVRVSFVVAAL